VRRGAGLRSGFAFWRDKDVLQMVGESRNRYARIVLSKKSVRCPDAADQLTTGSTSMS
jgi:hypothetical protein